MSHPLILLAVLVLPPTALYTTYCAGTRAYRATRRRVDLWRFRTRADRTWRAAERAEAAQAQDIHDRLIIPFLRDYATLNLMDWNVPYARQLAQWEVAQAIRVRYDAAEGRVRA